MSRRVGSSRSVVSLAVSLGVLALAESAWRPPAARAASVSNPLCPVENVTFNTSTGADIVVPDGYTIAVFAKGLNFPTGIAFVGSKTKFTVYVLESGHGLPSPCNDQSQFGTGDFDPQNPFTPDILVFDQDGHQIAGPLAKPTPRGGGLQPEGAAIDLAFEHGFQGGRLFATDSNQATHAHNGQNNSSRIVIVAPPPARSPPSSPTCPLATTQRNSSRSATPISIGRRARPPIAVWSVGTTATAKTSPISRVRTLSCVRTCLTRVGVC